MGLGGAVSTRAAMGGPGAREAASHRGVEGVLSGHGHEDLPRGRVVTDAGDGAATPAGDNIVTLDTFRKK